MLDRLIERLIGRLGARLRRPAIPPRPEPPAPPRPPVDVDLFQLWQANERTLTAHNAVRSLAKLPPLGTDNRLLAAAHRHALDCAARDELSHEGSDRSWPAHRIEQAGYRATRSSENAYVASWSATAQEATRAWLGSTVGHRENVLGDWDRVAAAYADTPDGRRYWVAVYATP